MRPSGSPKALELRRFRAVNLLGERLQSVEVAKKLGVDRRSIRRWNAAFVKDRPEAIRARMDTGRPPKISDQEKLKLEKKLHEGAKVAGFSTDKSKEYVNDVSFF